MDFNFPAKIHVIDGVRSHLKAMQDHRLMQNEKNMLPERGIEPTPSVAKNFPSVKKIFQVCGKFNFLNTWKIFLTLAEFS